MAITFLLVNKMHQYVSNSIDELYCVAEPQQNKNWQELSCNNYRLTTGNAVNEEHIL